MARLNKSDVEALLDAYDTNPVGALTVALSKVLVAPSATWEQLLELAPLDAGRRRALLARDQPALDSLARELNELRTL
jgi:hypothetical protein